MVVSSCKNVDIKCSNRLSGSIVESGNTDAHRQYCNHISLFFSLGTERKLNFPTYFMGNVQKYMLEICVCASVHFAEIVQNNWSLINVILHDQLNETTPT
jgi:hypothetical protein